MKLYLVRHGQSIANRQGVHQWRYDTSLTNLGKKQAMAVRDELQDVSFGKIFSSNLLRAKETAQIILEPHQNKKLVSTPLLQERQSPLGKRFRKSVFDTDKRRYFLRHFLPGFLGFETDSKIQQRAEITKKELIDPTIQKENILLVTHNDYMKHLIYILLWKDSAIFKKDSPKNAAISILENHSDTYTLTAYNYTDHLADLNS